MARSPLLIVFFALAAANGAQGQATPEATVKDLDASGGNKQEDLPAEDHPKLSEEATPAERLSAARRSEKEAAERLQSSINKLVEAKVPEVNDILKEIVGKNVERKDDFQKMLEAVANASMHEDVEAVHALKKDAKMELRSLQHAVERENRGALRKLSVMKRQAQNKIREMSKSAMGAAREAIRAARHVEAMARLAKVGENERERDWEESEERFERARDNAENRRDRLKDRMEEAYERVQEKLERDSDHQQDEADRKGDLIRQAAEGRLKMHLSHFPASTANVSSVEALGAGTVPTPVGVALSGVASWGVACTACAMLAFVVLSAFAVSYNGRLGRSRLHSPPLLG